MGRPGYQRARQPEQKAEREQQLLDAARRLLAKSTASPTQLSLTDLARAAGMAKSNTYRYFESREALLLALLFDEWQVFVDGVLAGLPDVDAGDDALAAFLAQRMAAQPILCRLNAVMAAVLEHNVSVETITSFKLSGVDLTLHLAQGIAAARPEHALEDYLELGTFMILAAAGLWPLAHPSEVVREALEHPGLAPFRHDFETDLHRMVTVLLRGLATQR